MMIRFLSFLLAVISVDEAFATERKQSRSLQIATLECGKGGDGCSTGPPAGAPGGTSCGDTIYSLQVGYQPTPCYGSLHVQDLETRCREFSPGIMSISDARYECRINTDRSNFLAGGTVSPGGTFTINGFGGEPLDRRTKCLFYDAAVGGSLVQEVLMVTSGGNPPLRTGDIFGSATIQSCGSSPVAPPPTPPAPVMTPVAPPTGPSPVAPTPTTYVLIPPGPPADPPTTSVVTPTGPSLPSGDQCLDPMFSMRLSYTNELCETSSNSQTDPSVWCNDYLPLQSSVEVECRENTPEGSSKLPVITASMDGTIMTGESFAVFGPVFGPTREPLPYKIKCTLFDPSSGQRLQEAVMITAGSGPMFIGDTFGAFRVEACLDTPPDPILPPVVAPVLPPVVSPVITSPSVIVSPTSPTEDADCCCVGGDRGKGKGYRDNFGDCCCCPPGSGTGKAKGDNNKNYPGGCDCRYNGKAKGYSYAEGDCPADYAGKAGMSGSMSMSMSGGSMMSRRATETETSVRKGIFFDGDFPF